MPEDAGKRCAEHVLKAMRAQDAADVPNTPRVRREALKAQAFHHLTAARFYALATKGDDVK